MQDEANHPNPDYPYSPPASMASLPVAPRIPGSVGGMLSEAWARLSRQPWLLIGTFLIVWLPLDVLMAYLDRYHYEADDFAKSFRMQRSLDIWIGSLAAGAIYFTAAAGSTVSSVGQALKLGSASWARLVGARILVGLALIGSLLLLILPGLWVGLKLSLADYAATVEDRSPTDALRRSWRLSQGNVVLLLRTNLVAFGLPLLILMPIIFVQAIAAEYFPALDNLAADILLGILTSVGSVFSLLCMQVVFEDLVAKETAQTPALSGDVGPAIGQA